MATKKSRLERLAEQQEALKAAIAAEKRKVAQAQANASRRRDNTVKFIFGGYYFEKFLKSTKEQQETFVASVAKSLPEGARRSNFIASVQAVMDESQKAQAAAAKSPKSAAATPAATMAATKPAAPVAQNTPSPNARPVAAAGATATQK